MNIMSYGSMMTVAQPHAEFPPDSNALAKYEADEHRSIVNRRSYIHDYEAPSVWKIRAVRIRESLIPFVLYRINTGVFTKKYSH